MKKIDLFLFVFSVCTLCYLFQCKKVGLYFKEYSINLAVGLDPYRLYLIRISTALLIGSLLGVEKSALIGFGAVIIFGTHIPNEYCIY